MCLGMLPLNNRYNNMIFQYGSQDSLDQDLMYVLSDSEFEELTSKGISTQMMKALEREYQVSNICHIADGMIDYTYKSVVDEINNSVIDTFHLHDYNNDLTNPVTKRMERDVGIKVIRCIRGILSYASRTKYRTEVKAALRSNDLYLKLELIEKIYSDIESVNTILHDVTKGTPLDINKFIAFQIAQTVALILGKEVYTKYDAVNAIRTYDPMGFFESAIYREWFTPECLHFMVLTGLPVIESIVTSSDSILNVCYTDISKI